MSPHSTHIRSRWIVVALFAYVAALPTAASAGTIIDQGSIDGAEPCSTLDAINTTCVLPFGDIASAPSVVTEIAVGDPNPDVRVATPLADKPGSWTVRAISPTPSRWKQRLNTGGTGSIFDVAIRLRTGEQLVLLDPLVSASGQTRDFNPTIADDGMSIIGVSDGEVMPIRPVGRVLIQADADEDGWGDDNQDLCPGVVRQICAPATVKVAISAPDYVPSEQDAVATWTVTNAGSDPQPMVVNLSSVEPTPIISGPPGSMCRPEGSTSALSAWNVTPSALVPRWSDLGQQQPYTASRLTNVFGGKWSTCLLPPLAPGASLSGTVGGRGGSFNGTPFQVEALPAVVSAESRSQSVLHAAARVAHSKRGQAVDGWKASEVLPGKIGTTRRWPVSFTCGGPSQAASCTGSIVAKAPVGGRVLGKSVPVTVKPGATASVAVAFSKFGVKWLATHRKSSVDLVVTSSWPGETSAVTTERARAQLSTAMKRKLTAMVKPNKRSKRR